MDSKVLTAVAVEHLFKVLGWSEMDEEDVIILLPHPPTPGAPLFGVRIPEGNGLAKPVFIVHDDEGANAPNRYIFVKSECEHTLNGCIRSAKLGGYFVPAGWWADILPTVGKFFGVRISENYEVIK